MSPRPIIEARTEDPPEDMKGRVMPVTGMMPIDIAMFSKIWNPKLPMNPTAISAP